MRLFSSTANRNRALLLSAAVVVAFIALTYTAQPIVDVLQDPMEAREFIHQFNIFAPLVFILIQVLQVLVAPIPGQVVGLASGFLFGATLGTLYTMIGTTLGSFIAFYLARRFGRPFVEKVIQHDTLDQFDSFSEEKGVFALFLIFLLPAFPDDAICFIAGLTPIRIRKLVLLAAAGRLPGFLVLNIIGAGVAHDYYLLSSILLGTALIISTIIYLHRDSIRQWLEHTFL